MNPSLNSKSLRVLVDLTHLLPGGANGGVKPFLFELIAWLGRQAGGNVQILFLTRASSHAEVRERLARLQDELICVLDDGVGPPATHRGMPRERVALPPPAHLAQELSADVLYCPFGPPDFACPGIPIVSLVVDVLHRDFPESIPAAEIAHREAYFARILAHADVIQCISQHVARRLGELYAITPERAFVTYIATQTRLAASHQKASAPRSGAPYFFFPANAWVHKNHEALLLAFRIYRERCAARGIEPWRLALTGHEDERWHFLRGLAGTLRLGDSVDFHGFVPAERLRELWRGAGALVFPSLHEGFGIPLLEAMSFGVPIIASNATCLPEIGGDACLFVDARRPLDLADAMERLAGDPDLAAKLASRGRGRLLAFNFAHEAGKLLEHLQTLAREQKGAGRRTATGIHADGWTEASGTLSLPRAAEGLHCLTIECRAIAADRRVILRAGDTEFGGFDLPAYAAGRLELPFRAPGGDPLRISVPNAASLSPSDLRCHGVHLERVRLTGPDGTVTTIFPLSV